MENYQFIDLIHLIKIEDNISFDSRLIMLFLLLEQTIINYIYQMYLANKIGNFNHF